MPAKSRSSSRKSKKSTTAPSPRASVSASREKSGIYVDWAISHSFLNLQLVKAALARLATLVVVLFLWFKSQSMLAARGVAAANANLNANNNNTNTNSAGVIGDTMHDLLTPLTLMIEKDKQLGNMLLASSAILIDVVTIIIVLSGLFWRFRACVSIVWGMILRQMMQFFVTLPSPQHLVWRDPGYNSILVTWEVATDFFPSGHTVTAVISAIELTKIAVCDVKNVFWRRVLIALGVLYAVYEVFVVLVTRSHYSMDVLTGLVIARYATLVSDKITSWLPEVLSGTHEEEDA